MPDFRLVQVNATKADHRKIVFFSTEMAAAVVRSGAREISGSVHAVLLHRRPEEEAEGDHLSRRLRPGQD